MDSILLQRSGLLSTSLLLLFLVPAAWGAGVATEGRLLYQLNCLGCHPMPAQDLGNFGAELQHTGAFYQAESGRRFFIRMPRPGAPWTADMDALLLGEINDWKRICPALKASTPLTRLRPEPGAR